MGMIAGDNAGSRGVPQGGAPVQTVGAVTNGGAPGQGDLATTFAVLTNLASGTGSVQAADEAAEGLNPYNLEETGTMPANQTVTCDYEQGGSGQGNQGSSDDSDSNSVPSLLSQISVAIKTGQPTGELQEKLSTAIQTQNPGVPGADGIAASVVSNLKVALEPTPFQKEISGLVAQLTTALTTGQSTASIQNQLAAALTVPNDSSMTVPAKNLAEAITSFTTAVLAHPQSSSSPTITANSHVAGTPDRETPTPSSSTTQATSFNQIGESAAGIASAFLYEAMEAYSKAQQSLIQTIAQSSQMSATMAIAGANSTITAANADARALQSQGQSAITSGAISIGGAAASTLYGAHSESSAKAGGEKTIAQAKSDNVQIGRMNTANPPAAAPVPLRVDGAPTPAGGTPLSVGGAPPPTTAPASGRGGAYDVGGSSSTGAVATPPTVTTTPATDGSATLTANSTAPALSTAPPVTGTAAPVPGGATTSTTGTTPPPRTEQEATDIKTLTTTGKLTDDPTGTRTTAATGKMTDMEKSDMGIVQTRTPQQAADAKTLSTDGKLLKDPRGTKADSIRGTEDNSKPSKMTSSEKDQMDVAIIKDKGFLPAKYDTPNGSRTTAAVGKITDPGERSALSTKTATAQENTNHKMAEGHRAVENASSRFAAGSTVMNSVFQGISSIVTAPFLFEQANLKQVAGAANAAAQLYNSASQADAKILDQAVQQVQTLSGNQSSLQQVLAGLSVKNA